MVTTLPSSSGRSYANGRRRCRRTACRCRRSAPSGGACATSCATAFTSTTAASCFSSFSVGAPSQYTVRPGPTSVFIIESTLAACTSSFQSPDTAVQSLVPMMNTTTSGSSRAISVVGVVGPVEEAGARQAARHARVEVGLHHAGGAGELAERGPERARQRVAADPEPQRLGRRRAGGSCGRRWWSSTAGDSSSLLGRVHGARERRLVARRRGAPCRSRAARPRRPRSTPRDDADDAAAASALAVAPPVTAIGGVPRWWLRDRPWGSARRAPRPGCVGTVRERNDDANRRAVRHRGAPSPDQAPNAAWSRRRGAAVCTAPATRAGDTPGWCGAMRTRSAAGCTSSRTGESRVTASPSMPVYDRLARAHLERRRASTRASPSRPDPRPAVDSETSCASSAPLCTSTTITPSTPSSRRAPRAEAADALELVDVVRHEDEVGVGVGDRVGAVELEVERVVVGAEELGQHLRRGVELGVAVLVGLHDGGVHAERHVVHEHPAVDAGEVDACARSRRRTRRARRRRRRGRRRGRGRSGCGCRRGCTRTARRAPRRCRRPAPASRRRRPCRPRRRPGAIASRASCSRSSPRWSVTVSMPRAWAAAANAAFAFPPPDHGFMIRIGCWAAPTACRATARRRSVDGSLRSAARASQREGRDQHDREHDVADAVVAQQGREGRPRPPPPRRSWRRGARLLASVTTYHAAISATSTSTNAPRSGAQLFQSTAIDHDQRRPTAAQQSRRARRAVELSGSYLEVCHPASAVGLVHRWVMSTCVRYRSV